MPSISTVVLKNVSKSFTAKQKYKKILTKFDGADKKGQLFIECWNSNIAEILGMYSTECKREKSKVKFPA